MRPAVISAAHPSMGASVRHCLSSRERGTAPTSPEHPQPGIHCSPINLLMKTSKASGSVILSRALLLLEHGFSPRCAAA